MRGEGQGRRGEADERRVKETGEGRRGVEKRVKWREGKGKREGMDGREGEGKG